MIQLKPIKPDDERIILGWLNNPEICKYNSHGVFPVTEPAAFDKNTLRLGVFASGSGEMERFDYLAGVIALQKIDWVNRSAELAILIKESGKGHGKEAARLICDHGFQQMNLHRIYCGTHEENIGMQKVAKALGMTLEGRTRQSFYKHGVYADTLHYGLLREEWKEI